MLARNGVDNLLQQFIRRALDGRRQLTQRRLHQLMFDYRRRHSLHFTKPVDLKALLGVMAEKLK